MISASTENPPESGPEVSSAREHIEPEYQQDGTSDPELKWLRELRRTLPSLTRLERVTFAVLCAEHVLGYYQASGLLSETGRAIIEQIWAGIPQTEWDPELIAGLEKSATAAISVEEDEADLVLAFEATLFALRTTQESERAAACEYAATSAVGVAASAETPVQLDGARLEVTWQRTLIEAVQARSSPSRHDFDDLMAPPQWPTFTSRA